MQALNYHCPKCANTQYEVGEIRAAGGFWSKIFDVQGQRYSAVTCPPLAGCRYTDFYKADTSMLGNIFDFFTN